MQRPKANGLVSRAWHGPVYPFKQKIYGREAHPPPTLKASRGLPPIEENELESPKVPTTVPHPYPGTENMDNGSQVPTRRKVEADAAQIAHVNGNDFKNLEREAAVPLKTSPPSDPRDVERHSSEHHSAASARFENKPLPVLPPSRPKVANWRLYDKPVEAGGLLKIPVVHPPHKNRDWEEFNTYLCDEKQADGAVAGPTQNGLGNGAGITRAAMLKHREIPPRFAPVSNHNGQSSWDQASHGQIHQDRNRFAPAPNYRESHWTQDTGRPTPQVNGGQVNGRQLPLAPNHAGEPHWDRAARVKPTNFVPNQYNGEPLWNQQAKVVNPAQLNRIDSGIHMYGSTNPGQNGFNGAEGPTGMPRWKTHETANQFFRRAATAELNRIETSALSPYILFMVTSSNLSTSIQRKRALRNPADGREVIQSALVVHTKVGIMDTSGLVSMTPELLRAFANAKDVARRGDTEVRILGVDMRKTEVGSFVACNFLRRRFNFTPELSAESEVLAWEEVPSHAVVFQWSWDAIQRSDLAQKHFPALKARPPTECADCALMQTPKTLYEDHEVQPFDVILCLHRDLGMRVDDPVTKQMVETFLALSGGHTCLRHYGRTDKAPRPVDKGDVERTFDIIRMAQRNYRLVGR